MKLLFRRDQSTTLFGRVRFTLDVRAEFSEEELQHIERYRLGDTPLYERRKLTEAGERLLGPLSRRVFNAFNLTVTVNDLVDGKEIECADITEVVAIEEEIRETAQYFTSVLEAAARFGGEEIVDL